MTTPTITDTERTLHTIMEIARVSTSALARVEKLRQVLTDLGDEHVSAARVADEIAVATAQTDILAFELAGGFAA